VDPGIVRIISNNSVIVVVVNN